MASTLSVLGIRHHGPGSARVLVRALDALDPAIVLIEGPPDASEVIGFAAAFGFYAAVQSVFDIHQTGHGHALSESGLPILMLLDGMKAEIGKPAPADQRGG